MSSTGRITPITKTTHAAHTCPLHEDDHAAARFLQLVDLPHDLSIEPCWTWTGARHSHNRGYGKFHLRGKTYNAHRAAYLLLRGPIAQGLVLGHQCNNEACVNPWHLVAQTQSDNMRYCVESGRHVSQQA